MRMQKAILLPLLFPILACSCQPTFAEKPFSEVIRTRYYSLQWYRRDAPATVLYTYILKIKGSQDREWIPIFDMFFRGKGDDGLPEIKTQEEAITVRIGKARIKRFSNLQYVNMKTHLRIVTVWLVP